MTNANKIDVGLTECISVTHINMIYMGYNRTMYIVSVSDIYVIYIEYTVYIVSDWYKYGKYGVYCIKWNWFCDSGAGHRAVWVGPDQSAGPRAAASLSLLCHWRCLLWATALQVNCTGLVVTKIYKSLNLVLNSKILNRKVHGFEISTQTWVCVLMWGKLVTVVLGYNLI